MLSTMLSVAGFLMLALGLVIGVFVRHIWERKFPKAVSTIDSFGAKAQTKIDSVKDRYNQP